MNFDKACFYLADEKQGTKNYPFVAGPEGEGFKNLLFPYVDLRYELSNYRIEFATRDINPPETSFITFCLDNPHAIRAEKKKGQIWCLVINDPPVYAPESWDASYHDRFDYVFTYNEELVDNKKYFYYPIAADTEYFSIPEIATEDEFNRRRLATTVSNAIHKFQDPNHPNCNHFRRYDTIKWYGENHPDDFRFFGGTFLERDYYFAFRGVSLAKRLVPPTLFSKAAAWMQKDLLKVYGGTLTPLQKFEVIKSFNFYYCYENTSGINGYLTEKIFDCLYSGVVPIYWGAPNVSDLIPYECFIDGRDFGTMEDLYRFIEGIGYPQYRNYLEQAHEFLSSSTMDRFTVKNSTRCLLAPLLSNSLFRERVGQMK